jgi:uncharacterized Zn-binding protein involved in type VI secretion
VTRLLSSGSFCEDLVTLLRALKLGHAPFSVGYDVCVDEPNKGELTGLPDPAELDSVEAPFAPKSDFAGAPFVPEGDDVNRPFASEGGDAFAPFVPNSDFAGAPFVPEGDDVNRPFASPNSDFAGAPFILEGDDVNRPFASEGGLTREESAVEEGTGILGAGVGGLRAGIGVF